MTRLEGISPMSGHSFGKRYFKGVNPSLGNAFFQSLGHDTQIRQHWRNNGRLSLFFFEIENFYAFTSLYGSELTGGFLSRLHERIEQVSQQYLSCAFTKVEHLDSGKMVLLCANGTVMDTTSDDEDNKKLADLALSMRFTLKSWLKAEAFKLTGQDLDLKVGFANIEGSHYMELETALYNSLCDAQRVAKGLLDGAKLSLMSEFRTIVDIGLIRSAYQPLVDLHSGDVFAWEALARGPEHSFFQSPTALFDFAEEAGEIFNLEKCCRESAIRNFGGPCADRKLFLNVHPKTLVDSNFSSGRTLSLLQEHGLMPQDVVFEITERHAIRDFTLFHRTLEHYRQQGYSVAVDDVGTGYSGLWSIAELRPDFIKLDMSLIRGIDMNPVKRALVETFVSFAEKIGCKIIAEGIETETELSSLVTLGTHYGQGFFLGRPRTPKAEPENRPHRFRAARVNLSEGSCSIPVRELVEYAQAVPPGTKVSDVKSRTDSRSEPIHSVVVIKGKRPVGLVMSHHLDRSLSMQYGMSLYYNRSLDKIMDPAPLIVEGSTAVEEVARRAMNRDKMKIYDNIVVTEQGAFSGLVSVQKMLDSLAKAQVRMAKGANPLSGLPGNVAIERELEGYLDKVAPFSIIYADLDNFKVYNDVYGFKSGDNIILLIAKILAWACKRHGAGDDFVGHVGGDDFVLITSHEKAERICKATARCFGRLAKYHYTDEDRGRGFILGKGRNNTLREFSLVTVSLAIVDCTGKCTLTELGKRSAEMKKVAKTREGNSYVRDRRALPAT